MPEQESKLGVRVLYCGHKGTFMADCYEVAGAVVVRAPVPVTMDNLDRHNKCVNTATWHLSDFPTAGFWRPDLGVFVVPAGQFRRIEQPIDAGNGST
jgi:hypothetical protein